ncbi:MAG: hypothetical protein IPP17_03420 [Bacteroidetes bacterium]|nr:hypothetical protein [Bacteroidota bacterium]
MDTPFHLFTSQVKIDDTFRKPPGADRREPLASALLCYPGTEVMMPDGGTRLRSETSACLTVMYHEVMVGPVIDRHASRQSTGLNSTQFHCATTKPWSEVEVVCSNSRKVVMESKQR